MDAPTNDEQILNYRDDQERKQFNDYKVGMRRPPLSNNILMLLGDILQPQTEGFEQINLDMSFSFQDQYGLKSVENSSFIITACKLYSFKRSLYLERSTLATHLVASRSLNGKSMELFTNTVSEQRQVFNDKTQKQSGFSAFFGKKKEE